jgi:hypothetical protein
MHGACSCSMHGASGCSMHRACSCSESSEPHLHFRESSEPPLQGMQSFNEGLSAGNHDLEGAEFSTDEENLQAWLQAFQQSHFWVRDVGAAVLVGISTTRFRSNSLSHHEVHVDSEQRAWLQAVLHNYQPDKPVIMFSHAPPMGCGLKVINSLHVKNRCALHQQLCDTGMHAPLRECIMHGTPLAAHHKCCNAAWHAWQCAVSAPWKRTR